MVHYINIKPLYYNMYRANLGENILYWISNEYESRVTKTTNRTKNTNKKNI